MPKPGPGAGRTAIGSVMFGAAILLAGLNLRPAITSVGPVLDQVRAALGASATWAGLLTALPVFCFAAGGLAAPYGARRIGRSRTVAVALALLPAGLVLRTLAGPRLVIVGTILAAFGIALIQVLLPALIRDRYAERAGGVAGGYTAALQGGSALGFALTAPLAAWLSGWRPAWAAWAVPAVIALLAWAAVLVRGRRGSRAGAAGQTDAVLSGPVVSGPVVSEPVAAEPVAAEPVVPPADPAAGERAGSLLRVPLAWLITAFFGLQALVAFVMMGWLPQLLLAAGVDRPTAGLLAGLLSALAVPVSLLVPPLARRGQSAWVAGLTLTGIAGVLGLIIAPSAAPVLWTILLGLGLSVFSLAIMIITLRADDGREAAALSGMAQGLGYVLAGTGPFVFGLLRDLTGDWTIPLWVVVAVLVLQLVTGTIAGRPGTLGRAPDRPAS